MFSRYLLIVAALLVGPAWAKPLYFVQVTDAHLSTEANWQRAEKAVEAINQLPFDISCVVITGDVFTDNWKDAEAVKRAKDLFGKFLAPCHVIPGNHDLDFSSQDSIGMWQKTFGSLFQTASYDGVGFVFMYTDPLADGNAPSPFKPLEDLRIYLGKDPKRPTFVFTHIPSAEDFYRNEMHPGWEEKGNKAWEEVLGTGNVQAVMTGHFHRDEFHWIGNIPLFVCPPIADHWDRQATFRVYEYENDRVSYRTIYIQ